LKYNTSDVIEIYKNSNCSGGDVFFTYIFWFWLKNLIYQVIIRI
jgi:hypothetical protein